MKTSTFLGLLFTVKVCVIIYYLDWGTYWHTCIYPSKAKGVACACHYNHKFYIVPVRRLRTNKPPKLLAKAKSERYRALPYL